MSEGGIWFFEMIFHFIILNVKPLGAVYVDQQFRVLLNAI